MNGRQGMRHWFEHHWRRFERTARGPVAGRKKMFNPSAKLSVSPQAILLRISRGSVDYQLRPVSVPDMKLFHRTCKLHMEFPFAPHGHCCAIPCRATGSRMLQGLLVQDGFKVGRLHVATLIKRMSIEALHRKPNTSRPAPGHKISPTCSGSCL